MTFDETRRLISVRSAAELVGVDAKTIRTWIATGDLSGYRVNGRLLRVEHEELLALIRPVRPIDGGAE